VANRIQGCERIGPRSRCQVRVPLARTLIVAGVLLASFAVGAPRPLLAGQDLGAKVAEAKTAADHEAIADVYEKQAKAFEAAAERHQGVADEYAKASYRQSQEAEAHASALAAGLRQAAKEASRLARMHRELAKSAAEK
jgi:hypothetical protein